MKENEEVRVLVCGDRRWDDVWIIGLILTGLLARYGDHLVVIEGDATGADQIAGAWCEQHGLTRKNRRLRVYPARWGAYGKRGRGDPAGTIRNRVMLKDEDPHLVIGFHNDFPASSGTKDMLDIAKKAGKKIIRIGTTQAVANLKLTV